MITSYLPLRCPLCSKDLSKNGSFLECPSGDYRAPAAKLVERWEKFDRDREGFSLISERGIELARGLLEDLKSMNIPRITPL